MELTLAQQQLLKAAITADGALGPLPNTPDNADIIAIAFNAEASPAFYFWKHDFSSDEMRTAITNGGGVTQLDGLTGSKRDSLFWYISGVVDPSQAATQTAFNDLCGSQNTLKAALVDGGKRKASRAEKVLVASGTGSLASPAVPGWEGTLSYQDVVDARKV